MVFRIIKDHCIHFGMLFMQPWGLLWLVIEDYSYQNIQHTDISIELWNISDIPTSPASEILSDHSRSLRIDN